MDRLICRVGLFVSMSLVVVVVFGATASGKSTTKKVFKDVAIRVDGMSCGGCIKTIKKALRPFKGIKTVKVSLKEKRCNVRYNPKKVTSAQLVAAIKKAGYDASLMKKKAKTPAKKR